MATERNHDAANRWIRKSLHNWLHNDLMFASDLEYLHHHHVTESQKGRVFVLEDWAWLWHAHEQEMDEPHDHEGWDWSWHEHGLPDLSVKPMEEMPELNIDAYRQRMFDDQQDESVTVFYDGE